MSDIVCYNEDTKGFIKRLARMNREWNGQPNIKGTEWTIRCRYNANQLRLIVATSGDILALYNIGFMNDQVYLTVKIDAVEQAA